jgi:hypothetical protein
MDPLTAQLIILGITLAEKVAFTVGGKIVEINAANLTDPKAIAAALAAASAEGFPQFEFKSSAV